MAHPMSGKAAICGLGMTEMGRVYRSSNDLAVEAVHLALNDAGLNKSQLDVNCANDTYTVQVILLRGPSLSSVLASPETRLRKHLI